PARRRCRASPPGACRRATTDRRVARTDVGRRTAASCELSNRSRVPAPGLELHVGDHRAERQREVGEREEVQPEGGALVAATVQREREPHERAAKEQRRNRVEAAEELA